MFTDSKKIDQGQSEGRQRARKDFAMLGHAKRQTDAVRRITTVLVLTTMTVLLAYLTVLPPHHANAASKAVTVLPINVNDILKAHNKYRTEVGDSALQWSGAVAQSALNWAKTMASTYQKCVHSSTSARSGHGENCAVSWPPGHSSATQMVDRWADEKKHFIPGCTFSLSESNNPCSNTGTWRDVGHYTQIVWRKTREVGCGFVSDGQKDFLICQYNPPGNIDREKVY